MYYASDTHGQVNVHADMAYKFNRDMHACVRHGDRPRRKNRKCHYIFSKALRRAISTPVGHSPYLSS